MPEHNATKPHSKPAVDGAGVDASALTLSSSRTSVPDWRPPSVEKLQKALPAYEIQQFLARGGMGAVYKARQRSLDRLVAIKVLPAETVADDPSFATRFRHEAQTLARLNHPSIVHVYDFGETEDCLRYFIMEFMDGTDVAAMISEHRRLPVETALKIITAVCDALSYAHEHGVIHRDIKPANILIDREGRVKVADFGIARMIDRTQQTILTRTDMTVGTQEYAAPEMFTPGATVDHHADIYAVGVMLYQMLTGEVPRVMFKLPSLRRPELGTRFDALICKALEPDPADRFESAAAMKSAIESELQGGASGEKKDRAAGMGARAPLFFVALATLALGVGAFYLFKKPANMADKAGIAEVDIIKLWNSPEAIPKDSAAKWEDNALRLEGVMMENPASICSDAEIRATVKMNPDARAAHIDLRGRRLKSPAGETQDVAYTLGVEPIRKVIQLLAFTPQWTLLREWPYPRSYGADEWARLRLRIVGDEITASFDGKVLGTIHDNSITRPGKARVYGKEKAFFRDIAFVPLGNPSENQNTPEAHPIRLWNSQDKIKKSEGVSWEDGALRLDNAMEVTPPPHHADAVIRASIKMNPDAVSPSLSLRGFEEKGAEGRYSATLLAAEKKINLQVFDTRPSSISRRTVLHEWPLPRVYAADEWAQLELRATGDELALSLDGQTFGTVHDKTLTEPGTAQVWATRAGFFRDIVYTPLDPPTDRSVPVITNWQDMTETVREKARSMPNLVVDASSVRHRGSGDQAVVPITRHGVRDYAIRLDFVSDGEIGLRSSPGAFLYVLCQSNQTIFHHYEVAKPIPTPLLPNVPHPADFAARPTHEMLVTMQGPILRVWLDGRFVGEASDPKCPDGDAKLVFTKSTSVRKVEVAELSADR